MATHKPVVSLNEDGQPTVNYNPRLVAITREVRHLRVLGYNIPSRVVELDEKAQKYYNEAKDLQQIVSFYRTIGDHMILSQQPMMLEAARLFTQLVTEKSSVSWDDPSAVDAYIKRLQEVVQRLSRENRMLRKQHFVVLEKVLSLMGADLTRYQQKWKNSLNDIRTLMAKLEEQGFSPEYMRPWRAHWDRQLYKALECQYRLGLITLNENLPEIRVDLTYRNGHLQFRPPAEEIRAKYFTHIKKFLNIPLMFRGVSDVTENLIFPIIVDRNANLFVSVYRSAENLFASLESLKDKFRVNGFLFIYLVSCNVFILGNFSF